MIIIGWWRETYCDKIVILAKSFWDIKSVDTKENSEHWGIFRHKVHIQQLRIIFRERKGFFDIFSSLLSGIIFSNPFIVEVPLDYLISVHRLPFVLVVY